MIRFVLGRILIVEGFLLLLPMLVSLIYQESPMPFIITAVAVCITGFLLSGLKSPEKKVLYARDGFAVVALAWILVSLFGALPFVISGDIPNYVDAIFETVSGFTTTGASILNEVEPLHKGMLFWRSFTHWIGGMGVLVFVMAILPMSDGHGMHLLRAEVPGPSVGKLASRMSDSAKILYGMYFILTIIEIIFLIAGGMPLFDAAIHSFGSAGTGGFSCKNTSVGAYDNAYFDIVIGIFMLLFGVNFNLYYFILQRRFREAFRSEELRAYILIVTASVLVIAINIKKYYGGFWTALRYSFFQVSSIITTTGYGTTDFNLWPTLSKAILVSLMFIGACAGSTGGGIKVARVVILFKSSISDMRKMLHPKAISTVRFEGKVQTEKNIRSIHLFFTVYFIIFTVSMLLLSLQGFDLITTFTAVAACINNIGPGLEIVGPMGNFSTFAPWAKLLLSFDMLAGRLELFPMLLLFAPSVWKRKNKSSRHLSNSKKIANK